MFCNLGELVQLCSKYYHLWLYRGFFQYLFEPFGYVKMKDREHQQELSTYKYHRTRTTASVYHSLMRDRYNRQYAESAEEEAGASGPSQSHTPPSLLKVR